MVLSVGTITRDVYFNLNVYKNTDGNLKIKGNRLTTGKGK